MESLLANSDNGRRKDSTMFDYLGNLVIHASHCPPLDTEDKMNTQSSDFWFFLILSFFFALSMTVREG